MRRKRNNLSEKRAYNITWYNGPAGCVMSLFLTHILLYGMLVHPLVCRPPGCLCGWMLVAVKDGAGDPPAQCVQVITGLTRPLRGSFFEITVLFLGLLSWYPVLRRKENHRLKEDTQMKGYYSNSGYMGYVEGSWVLFASEGDYREYMED